MFKRATLSVSMVVLVLDLLAALVIGATAARAAEPVLKSDRGKLWRNSGNKNRWVKVRPLGTEDYNRSAIGAQIRIKLAEHIITRQVESSTGRGNLNDFVPHFGLGAYQGESVEITVTWPNGHAKKETVEVNELATGNMPEDTHE